ncbi:MAG: lamin tail domain-containing protein [Bacteroidetes bacterium]|nr:lamin tail domain-containing protein [Bacteroidota bacterium]
MKKILICAIMMAATQFAKAQCKELFISEYLEGKGNDKGVEIYNPTKDTVDLSAYRLVRFANGSTSGSDSLLLKGKLGPYKTWVVINGQTTDQTLSGGGVSPKCDSILQTKANQLDNAYPAPCYFNGDDALGLVKFTTTTWALVDIFGKIGEQPLGPKHTISPNGGWSDTYPYNSGDGTYWTKDHGMVRKPSIKNGVSVNPTFFNPTADWDSLSVHVWDSLGKHTCNCKTTTVGIDENIAVTNFSVYPNPITTSEFYIMPTSSVSLVQIADVTGRIVYTKKVTNFGAIKVELHKEHGIYLVKLTGDNLLPLVKKVLIP